MGYPKALRLIEREHAVVAMAQTMHESGLREIFITLPPFLLHENFLCQKLKTLFCEISANKFESHGYAGSIMTILKKHGACFDGIIIIPIDSSANKNLTRTMLNLAQSEWAKPLIILPYYDLRPGHPVYLSKHFFSNLECCYKRAGMRSVILENALYTKLLYWPDPNILANINHPSRTQS